jgi:hypothetical protein
MAAGVTLFFTPVIFGVAWHPLADAVATVGGLLLILIGAWDLVHPMDRIGECLEGVLGLTLLLSPWILDAAGLTHMAWGTWLIGLCTILLTVFLVKSQPTGQSAARQGRSSDGERPGVFR